MLFTNAQKKKTLAIQVIVCFLLMALAVVFSFMPVATIDLKSADNKNAFQSKMDSMVGETVNLELPESVEITAGKSFKSISLLVKLVSGASETVKTGGDTSKIHDAIFDKDGNVKEDVKETLIVAVSLATAIIGDNLESNGSSSGVNIGKILLIAFSVGAVLYITLFSIIVPIIYILMLITSLFSVLKNIDELSEKVHKVSGKLPKVVTFPLLFMIFPYILPRMSYGTGPLLLLIITIVSVLFNAAIARLNVLGSEKAVKKSANTNMNIVQGLSLVAMVGFLVFFLGFMQTDLITTFFNGKWAQYAFDAGVKKLADPKANISNLFLIDSLLLVLMMVLLLSTVPKYFSKNLQRFSLTAKNDNHIALSIVNLLIVIIPLALTMMKHGYENFIDASKGAYSFLELSAAQNSALMLGLVGLIIMLASEIAIIVLKKVFGSKVAAVENGSEEKAENVEAFEETKEEPAEKEVAASDDKTAE